MSSAWIAATRRWLLVKAIKGALSISRALPRTAIGNLTHLAAALAARSPLRQHLRLNMTLGLGARGVPSETLERYFQRLARWSAYSLLVYRRGLAGSTIGKHFHLGESVRHLDQAVARGRGVLVLGPHVFGHEIAAGIMGQRHKLAALVRAAPSGKEKLKKCWYAAVGL